MANSAPIFLIVAPVLLAPLSVQAGEFRVTPRITVSQEFTDNVFSTAGSREYDFITRAMPGVDLRYQSNRLRWTSGYHFDYRYYARGTRSEDTTHGADVSGTLTILDNFLFLKVTDVYRRVSLDNSRDTTQESLFVNQTDTNNLSVSPYASWKIGERGTISTGYRYGNIWYRDPAAVDKTSHVGFGTFSYEMSPKLSTTAKYSFARVFADEAEMRANGGRFPRYDRHDASAGFKYEFADKSHFSAEGGMSAILYRGGATTKNPYWSASVTSIHDNVTAKLATSQQYEEDPLRNLTRQTVYSGDIDVKAGRGTFGTGLWYKDFSNGGFNDRPTTIYGAALRGRYAMSERLATTLTISGENFVSSAMSNSPRRLIGDFGLSYNFSDKLAASVGYKYLDSYSKLDPENTFQVSRVIVEIRKSF